MAYTDKVHFTATGRYGCGPDDEDDVYTVEEFNNLCDCSSLIDYDGWGYPVRDSLADRTIQIRPSKRHLIPEDATHIVWYNR